jgi:hypothetical protein
MAEPITIGNSANKWIKDANTLGLTFSESYAGAVSGDGTDTIYTCPVGKVATVISVGLAAAGDWDTVNAQIWANGSPIAGITCAPGEGNAAAYSMNVYARITAGQIVQFYRASNNNSSRASLSFFLVETDP